ncbi:MAG TPA: hypothetical protein VLX92_27230 [Kofleriaceae bacterium]|nr:hypothetical protein [Kofleriaceae bacterium]
MTAIVASRAAHAQSAPLARFHPVLIGAFGGGHGHGGRAPHGWFLGADTGWAWLVGMSDVDARESSPPRDNHWCFGARAGYQLATGLAVQVRYDRLGVEAPDDHAIGAVSAGVRYSVPIVPMPFAEAMVGPTFHGSSVEAGAGVGIGVSLLVARHLAFDLAARDWIVDLGGVHHIPTVTFGISAGFGG